jgi:uncharacterized Tic20 family protein
MNDRKKKGLGYFISGAVFIAVGIVLMVTTSTPGWVSTVLSGIGLIGNLVGFILVLPTDVT